MQILAFRRGGKKLIRLFTSLKPYEGFEQIDRICWDDVKNSLPEPIKERAKRFYDGKITFKIKEFEDKEQNSISEMVWHIIDNHKLGIGYVVTSRILWLWDYTDKCYLDKNKLDSFPKYKELCHSVMKIINEM